jgi:ribosomal protein L27
MTYRSAAMGRLTPRAEGRNVPPMNALLKIAVTAGVAGALVTMVLKKQRQSRDSSASANDSSVGASPIAGAPEASNDQSLGNMASDTNMVSGGNAYEEQRGTQPQDWRGAQNVLE